MATSGAAPEGRREQLKRIGAVASMVAALAAAWSLGDRVRTVDLLTLFAGGAVFATSCIALVRTLRARAAREREVDPPAVSRGEDA
jgi:hypothetical protein